MNSSGMFLKFNSYTVESNKYSQDNLRDLLNCLVPLMVIKRRELLSTALAMPCLMLCPAPQQSVVTLIDTTRDG